MMKALQAYNQEDLNNLASKAKIVSMQNNKKDNVDYTLTKKSVVSISNNFVGIQNEFNKIAANITSIKALQNKVMNDRSIPVNDNTPVATRIIGADQFEDSIAGLGEYFETLAKLLKKLNLKTPETVQPEAEGGDIDIDINKKRARGSRRTRARGRGRLRGRGLAGKALGIFGVGLDVTDRLSSGEDVAEAAVGVAGGVAGGIAGAEAGAALGLFGGPAAPVTVPLGGLIGGALGYLAGGFIADKAYDAVAEPSTQRVPTTKPAQSTPVQRSSVDRRLESAVKTASAAPAVRQPSEISNNSYSSRFASYLSDVFSNVKGYIGGMAGAVIGATVGNYSPVGPGAGSTENARIAMQYLTSPEGGGWTQAQAAGIVANLQAESGANLDTTALNEEGGGQGAHGIAQWRAERITRFTEMYNKPIRSASLQEQLAYINWELNNTESRAGRSLRGATTAEQAADIFYRQYERPGDTDTSGGLRISNARALLTPSPTSRNGNYGVVFNPLPNGTYSGPGLGLLREGGKRRHQGLDIFAPMGSPVYSMADGTVVYSERRSGDGGGSGFGIAVQIRHDNGLVTKYAHLSGLAGLHKGDRVTGGQFIGSSGDTGNAKGTPPHLHFEVWEGSTALEPTAVLGSGSPTPAPATSMDRYRAATPSRASLMQNPNIAAQYFDALRPNRRRGAGSLILMPSAAPAQPTITFPYRFGQSPPRQTNANPRSAYPAYHRQ
jgi:murein DD-endopeptidase MepM/ murein hydrolase activator NlpD